MSTHNFSTVTYPQSLLIGDFILFFNKKYVYLAITNRNIKI